MNTQPAFVSEIEHAIATASADRRGEILHKVTDLFVNGSDGFTAEDLSIFDDVIVRLAAAIERSARALLARRLAPIRNAPPGAIRLLAFDDAIEVAGPVLAQSVRLDDDALVENARTKGQAHMLAISQRGALSEAVTDVLVELGDSEVVLSTVDNYGASFSERGFSVLVQRSRNDDVLAECVGARPEIPVHLLSVLIAQASQSVRSKLEATHPRARDEVRRAVAEAAGHVEAQALRAAADHAAGIAVVESLRKSGRLDEASLAEFAKRGAYVETTAVLAAMCDLPFRFVEQAVAEGRSRSFLVLAKAAGLSWPTVKDILSLRAGRGLITHAEVAACLARFERLGATAARDIVQYYRIRARANKPPPA